MNDQISWDQSIVKKYSSSNHYKLLNQLRSEVKKYPLNNKKKNLSKINDNIKFEVNNNQIKSSSQDLLKDEPSISNTELNDKSYVGFNNSKNFSIYKNLNNESPSEKLETNILDVKELNDKGSLSTFKNRLEQIEMK